MIMTAFTHSTLNNRTIPRPAARFWSHSSWLNSTRLSTPPIVWPDLQRSHTSYLHPLSNLTPILSCLSSDVRCTETAHIRDQCRLPPALEELLSHLSPLSTALSLTSVCPSKKGPSLLASQAHQIIHLHAIDITDIFSNQSTLTTTSPPRKSLHN
jgi:hypothetical protein